MIIVSAQEMREIDANCGVAGRELMQNAARAALNPLKELQPEGEILVLAGRGNNGGDGFALAWLLRQEGRPVQVHATTRDEELRGEAAAYCHLARGSGVPFLERARFIKELDRAAVLVDALFGTGLRNEALPAAEAELIAFVNSARAERPELRVLALDVPSGIAADTGRILGPAVKADLTVTFGRPKRGLFLYPAADLAGRIITDRIGIPDAAFAEIPGLRPEAARIASLLPRRLPTAHKGAARLLVMGGAAGMTGAAQLAARAALKSGAGHVTLILPRGVADNGWPVEAVRRPLAGQDGRFAAAAGRDLAALAATAHAVVFGMGLGRGPAESEVTARALAEVMQPAVIDADALRQTTPEALRRSAGPRVLTPHAAEFAALFGMTVAALEADRVGKALAAARDAGQVVLVKGRPTVVASPDGRYAVNPTGNELLATCGSGDVLAGLIGALLAQGLAPYEAAVAGAYLHGDTVRGWPAPVGLTASEIAARLPEAWGRCVGREQEVDLGRMEFDC